MSSAYKKSPALYPSLAIPPLFHSGAFPSEFITNTCPAVPLLSAIIPLSPAYKMSPTSYPSLETPALPHSGVVASLFISNACPAVPLLSAVIPLSPAYKMSPISYPLFTTYPLISTAFHSGVFSSFIVNTVPTLPALNTINLLSLVSSAYKKSPALYPSLATPAGIHSGVFLRESAFIANTCPALPALSEVNSPSLSAYKKAPSVYPFRGAFKSSTVCVAVETFLLASLVLSTLDKPTIVLSIPFTLPVKIGSFSGAFKTKPGTVGALAVPPRSPANCIFPMVSVLASATPEAVIPST